VVPRIKGGIKTVPLCGSCHDKVHGSKNLLSTNSLSKIGLAEKKKKGELVGAVPFGFDLAADQKTLIKNQKEQDIIKAIILARLSNYGSYQIARWLTAVCISTKTKKNKKWSHAAVARIIKREASDLKTLTGTARNYKYFSKFKKHIADMDITIMI